MSQTFQKIDLLGRREASSAPSTGAQRVFASVAGAAATRQAISLSNLDAASDLLVNLAASGSAAPTISSTDCDLVVPARTNRQFQVGVGIDLWVRSAGAASAAYTALELV